MSKFIDSFYPRHEIGASLHPSHRRAVDPLPIHLHDHDLTCRHQRPQQFVKGIGRNADDLFKSFPRYARSTRFGNHQCQRRHIGDFFNAMF